MRLLSSIAVTIVLIAACGGANADALPDPSGCSSFTPEMKGADPACDRAIVQEQDPANKSILLFRRAYALIDLKDFSVYPKAMADLTEAIRHWPGNYRALQERAYLNNDLCRWTDALKDADAAIQLRPQDFQGYFERAMAHFYLGDFQGSYDDKKSAVLLRPGASAIIARADGALWLGQFEDANSDLVLAATMNMSEDDTQYANGLKDELARETKASKRGAKACTDKDGDAATQAPTFIGDCTRAFLDAKSAKDRADALTTRASGWLAAGKEEDWWVDLSIAASLDPDNAERFADLGYADLKTQRTSAAIDAFGRAITLKPSAKAYAGRAAAKYDTEDYDGAITDANASLALKRNALALKVLGNATFVKSKSTDAAKAFWLEAYQLGDHSTGLLKRLKDASVPEPVPESTGQK